MRFRKRIHVFPGFYLNVSPSGISSNIGFKGANITFSKRGTYINTSIPQLGLYDRRKINSKPSHPDTVPVKIPTATISTGEIKSLDSEQLTSSSFMDLKDALLKAYKDRIELEEELNVVTKRIQFNKLLHIVSCILLIGFVVKHFKNQVNESVDYLNDLQEQLANCVVNIDIHFDEVFESPYLKMVDAYKNLLSIQKIWDITASNFQDRKITRSAASTLITRSEVKFKFNNIDIIKSSHAAFHFENKNGGDLYIYPAFVIIRNSKYEFGILDIKEFSLSFAQQRFLEEDPIPSDTQVIDKTWAKVNKNGQPDKRFKDNYQIPIVQYGQIDLQSHSGLNESYSFSNFETSKSFAEAFSAYHTTIC